MSHTKVVDGFMDTFYFTDKPDLDESCEIKLDEKGIPLIISYEEADGTSRVYKTVKKEGNSIIMKLEGLEGHAHMLVVPATKEAFGMWVESRYEGMWKVHW